MKNRYHFICFVVVCVCFIWFYQHMVDSGRYTTYMLPSLDKIASSFLTGIQNGSLFHHIGISLWRIAQGFLISFLCAMSLAVLETFFPHIKCWYAYLFTFMRNVPPLSLIPLLILWAGIGETTKLIIIFLASFFPMYMNFVSGMTSCSPALLEVGDIFHFNKLQKFTRIIFPSAMNSILVGIRIGIGYCFRAIIGAEMIAAASGLGYYILDSQQMSRVDKVIVGILIIGILGVIFDSLLSLLISKSKWRKENLHADID